MPTVNNPRVYLWAALAALLFLDYQSWLHDHPGLGTQGPAASATVHPAAPPVDLSKQVPQASVTAAPGAAPSSAASPAVTEAAEVPVPATAPAGAAPLIHVRTDVLDLEISTRGGTLERADLLAYPLVKGGATPVRLENDDSPETLYELESGLVGRGNAPYPTHLATFESARSDYEMDGASELRVPLTWTGPDGVTVTKTYVFRRGDYRIDLDYQVHNGGSAPWEASPYTQILRNDPRTKTSYFNVASYAFHGPALWDGDKYRKLNPTDAQDSHFALEVTNGWIAALQHHFVSAIVPPKGARYRFTLEVEGDRYLLAATGPGQTIAPGGTGELTQTLFVGPKLQAQLEATAPELGRVADYGRLWFLARPLFLALSFVHRLTGNWGVAIIAVTFLLKLLFYPLSEASGRSMAKMKTLGPRIKNLQETYADDREKLGRAMMELYKREKVNPVAGCLPMIIQIPVFIAFYWVLLESAEMRQAPFVLWIHDLSSRDPYFILPAIMAVAMFVQYKLNPAPPDPVQAKMFMIMPIVMSATFAFFPAGLVLYWVTNTVLSIAQQWNINRRIAAAVAAKKN
jgi:YidC/Oxa1 family membrane protein insertase